MCLLTYFPIGADVDRDRLLAGTVINSDGHGFAIVDNDNDCLIVHKGMKGSEVVDAFETSRALHPNGPALFHSRIGTAGPNDLDNCHPFYVGRDRRTVLAHNGILPAWMQPVKGSTWSDTRLLALQLVPQRYGPLWLKHNQQRLANAITAYNKLVILTVNPSYGKQGIIINEKEGDWLDGVWYSNTSFAWAMPGHKGGIRHAYRPGDYAPTDRSCVMCGRSLLVVDMRLGSCNWCDACVSCDMQPRDCDCYGLPRGLDDDNLEECWCKSSWPLKYCHGTTADKKTWWDDAQSPVVLGPPRDGTEAEFSGAMKLLRTRHASGKELVPARALKTAVKVDDRGNILPN